MKRKPFQDVGVQFLKTKQYALLADEMRLGKTVQAIGAFDELKARRILILCPATVKLGWEAELKLWSTMSRKVQVVNGIRAQIDPTAEVVIVNYDLLVHIEIWRQLRALSFDVGIVDEAHYLKGRDSQRTKAVLKRGGIGARCKRLWFLTGTPILNRPVELYPILRAVAKNIIAPYTSFTSFATHFCAGFFDGLAFIATGASNTEELNKRLQGFMLRRTQAEVFEEYHEPVYQLISLPKDGSIEETVTKQLSWARGDASFQGSEEEHQAIVRKRLGKYKIPFILKHSKYLLENTHKLVIFGHHPSHLQELASGLSEYNPRTITGETDIAIRKRYELEFKNDPSVRVMCAQQQATGVGVDFSAADTAIFFESSYVPGEIDQAANRLQNIHKRRATLVQFLVVQDSLDEHMLRIVIEKKMTIKSIVEKPQPEKESPCLLKMLS